MFLFFGDPSHQPQELDFGRPVALMLMAILQHLGDEDDPYEIVATLLGALPPGSYLALSHPAKDIDADSMAKMADSLNQMMAEKVTFRDRPAVARFFDGLELAEPGMVQASKWRPASELEAASPAALWAGVARKSSSRTQGIPSLPGRARTVGPATGSCPGGCGNGMLSSRTRLSILTRASMQLARIR